MNASSLRSHRIKLALVGVIAAVAFLSGSTPSRAQFCITTLPMSWSLNSHFAASWTKTLDVSVDTNGPTITGLSVSISTFGGDILGKGTLPYALTGSGTIKVKLMYPMQPGKFSLYFYGFPNADPSCGPKHLASTVGMTGCTGTLPVKIIGATEGDASAYGNYYSFNVEPKDGQLFRGLAASLSTFDGTIAGKTTIPVLFGDLRVSIPLRRGIAPVPTKYTLDISGYAGGRPRACGPAETRRTLAFH